MRREGLGFAQEGGREGGRDGRRGGVGERAWNKKQRDCACCCVALLGQEGREGGREGGEVKEKEWRRDGAPVT